MFVQRKNTNDISLKIHKAEYHIFETEREDNQSEDFSQQTIDQETLKIYQKQEIEKLLIFMNNYKQKKQNVGILGSILPIEVELHQEQEKYNRRRNPIASEVKIQLHNITQIMINVWNGAQLPEFKEIEKQSQFLELMRNILNSKFIENWAQDDQEFIKQMYNLERCKSRIRADHQMNFFFKKFIYRFRTLQYNGKHSLLQEFYDYYFQSVCTKEDFDKLFYSKSHNLILYRKKKQTFSLMKRSDKFKNDMSQIRESILNKQRTKIKRFFTQFVGNIIGECEKKGFIDWNLLMKHFVYTKKHLFPRTLSEVYEAFTLFNNVLLQ